MSQDHYRVVVNEAGQYSVWRVDRPTPAGWSAAGFAGATGECLAHIGRVWTTLTPPEPAHEDTSVPVAEPAAEPRR